jgi:hypothetical protein
MTSISSVAPSTAASTASAVANPVAKASASPFLASEATTLALDAGVIVSLGGGSSSSLTYDATGLFNSLAQAGQLSGAALTPGANSQTSATQSLNQGILNGLPSTATSSSTLAASSGVYNSAGTVEPTSTNWANALKANPALASTVIADSYDQGIVATL